MLFLLFVSTKSLSCFCRRWTCDRRWDKRKHKHSPSDNVTVAVAVSTVAVVVLSPTDVTRLAWVEQRWSRREGDGIWHQNDELLRHEPAHVAHRQPEAEPEEPEEQRVDLFQVISEPQLRSNDACWNFHHFENSKRWLFRESHGHDHRSPTLV